MRSTVEQEILRRTLLKRRELLLISIKRGPLPTQVCRNCERKAAAIEHTASRT